MHSNIVRQPLLGTSFSCWLWKYFCHSLRPETRQDLRVFIDHNILNHLSLVMGWFKLCAMMWASHTKSKPKLVKLILCVWALQLALVNKSINLGTTNTDRIDLPLKTPSCYVIRLIHSLNSLIIMMELWCHQGTFDATCICLLFGSTTLF